MAPKYLLQSMNSMILKSQMRFFNQTAPLCRVENVVIIGSGLMGSGIAQSCATVGKFNSIILHDVNQEVLNKAQKRIIQSLTKLSEKKRINIDKPVEEVAARITLSTEVKPVSEKNLLIIEAVPEVLELKQNIFKKLSAQFKGNDTVIFATNTSSLPCHKINKFIEAKHQFAALHFFNPVPLMKLVEVARTLETNDFTFQSLQQFVRDIDHVDVACKDNQGFIVNRLLSPYMHEALRLLDEGIATAEDIDTAMKLGAGYPMGPFELLDYVGLDTHSHVADSFTSGDPEFKSLYRSKTLDGLVAKGHLGRKTGKGFYDYSKEGKK